jgi:hypothetical protein
MFAISGLRPASARSSAALPGAGAAIGAGVGGGAGTAHTLATRGEPAVVPAETLLTFRLRSAVNISER